LETTTFIFCRLLTVYIKQAQYTLTSQACQALEGKT